MNDRELLRAFLSTIDRLRLSNAEAGEAVGLSHEQIRKYRRGEWKRLAAGTRRKLERYLRLQPAQESPTYAEGIRHAADRMESVLDELRGMTADGSAGRMSRRSGGARQHGPGPDSSLLPPAAAALIRLSRAERADLGPHAGPREALSLERALREAGRLSPQDDLAWQAYRLGRDDVPWSELDPAERHWDPESLLLGDPADVFRDRRREG